MRATKLSSVFAVILALGTRLFAPGAFAGEAAENPAPTNTAATSCTNAACLKACVKFEGGPNLLPTYVAYLTLGTNKIGFAMPNGFHLSNVESNHVVLANAEFTSLLTWSIIGPAPANGEELDPEYYKSLLLSQHPGGKIISEFSQVAGGHSGPAFEIRWTGKGGLERQEMAVFVACPFGIVEYDLVSSLAKYGDARQNMNTAMLTLRWNDDTGKLTMPVFSNRL